MYTCTFHVPESMYYIILFKFLWWKCFPRVFYLNRDLIHTLHKYSSHKLKFCDTINVNFCLMIKSSEKKSNIISSSLAVVTSLFDLSISLFRLESLLYVFLYAIFFNYPFLVDRAGCAYFVSFFIFVNLFPS